MEDNLSKALWEACQDVKVAREDLLPAQWQQETYSCLMNQTWFDAAFEVSYNFSRPPALFCFFSLEAFRHHFRKMILEREAFQEVCRRHRIEFQVRDVKAWQDILKTREDLVAEARLLSYDPDFVVSVTERVKSLTGYYMSLLSGDDILHAVATGIEMLVARVSSQVRDDAAYQTGNEVPDVTVRQQPLINIARMFYSKYPGGIRRPKKPKKKGWAFNYRELCEVTLRLGENATAAAVGNRLGCSNLRRTLGYDGNRQMLIEVHHHTDVRWPILRSEIFERHCK